jgi:hypothetical protein
MPQFVMEPDGPIVLETFGSLARYGYAISVHCWRCERLVEIDSSAFPADMSYCTTMCIVELGSVLTSHMSWHT